MDHMNRRLQEATSNLGSANLLRKVVSRMMSSNDRELQKLRDVVACDNCTL